MGGRPLARSARPAILSNELIQRQTSGRLRERPFRTLAMRNDFPTFECLGITKSWEGEVWRGRHMGKSYQTIFSDQGGRGCLQLGVTKTQQILPNV